MKIQILSDLHLEMLYERDREVVEQTDADIVVLAGDIHHGPEATEWAAAQADLLDKQILLIAGNHEFYGKEISSTLALMRQKCEGTRVHFLEKDTVVINDVRFLGCMLWTDYQATKTKAESMQAAADMMNDHRLIRLDHQTFTPADALRLHEESVAWLAKELQKPFDGKTAVITHHGPSPKCQSEIYPLSNISAAFWSDLEHLMGGVDLWVYGHTHSNLDSMVGSTRVVSNQCGYRRSVDDKPEVPDFDPRFLITI
jgi:predicted phosphodiesterase